MLSYHETANQIRHRMIYKGNYAILPEVMDDVKPRMLIAALGCNDIATYEMEHCEEMVVAFLDLVREIDPDITIIMQAVMPIRVNMTTFNQKESVFKKLIEKYPKIKKHPPRIPFWHSWRMKLFEDNLFS